jgi:branched-chain amino acid transport system ATP-binding protein
MMLEVRGLDVRYGNIVALKGVSLSVNRGELVAVIGSNGAGKTTMLRAISSLLAVHAGEILFEGQSLLRVPAHQVTGLGIAHCPEGRRVFAQQSVRDNLVLGAYLRARRDGMDQVARQMEKVFDVFPRLRERQHQMAGTLSGGEQQMLAIGRALMSSPTMLMLDEPSMGLAPVIIDEVFRVIRALHESGATTVLLVEQLAYRALQVADRAYVLEQGSIRLTGTGKELLANPAVRSAYLGATHHHTTAG